MSRTSVRTPWRHLLGRTAEDQAGDAVHERHAIAGEVALDERVRQVEAQVVELVPQRGELLTQGVDLTRHGNEATIPAWR